VDPARSPFAIVFDVDGTLAPDTTSQFLAGRGVDVDAFWSRSHERMREGWDPITSYMHEFVIESGGPHGPFTRDEMGTAARGLALFPGVPTLFDRLAALLAPRGYEAEFYLISGGLAPIVANLAIAARCRGIWASEFDYDDRGRPSFPKAIVGFTDKTKPLIEISLGLTQADVQADPYLVDRPIDEGTFRIPFGRVVFVGDGTNDVPCFVLLAAHGGGAIAVYQAGDAWAEGRARSYRAEGRVGWVAAADYTPDGAAYRALTEAIEILTEC